MAARDSGPPPRRSSTARNLLGTARILAHSPAMALKHYNRAGALEASRVAPACGVHRRGGGRRGAHARAKTGEPS
jgi:hypothetical protein